MRIKSPVKILLVVGVLVLLLFCCIGCSLIIAGISTYNTLQAKENALTTEYDNMAQSLTDYFVKTKGALGISDRNSDKLQEIFKDAMNTSRKDSDFHNPNNVIYQKIQAAYPNVGKVSYEKAQDILVSSYDDYSQATKSLRDHVREYRSTIGSFPNNVLVSFLGFPSDRLEVTVNGQPYHGADALKQMEKVIQDPSAANSINSGVLQSLFTTPTPVPTSDGR